MQQIGQNVGQPENYLNCQSHLLCQRGCNQQNRAITSHGWLAAISESRCLLAVWLSRVAADYVTITI